MNDTWTVTKTVDALKTGDRIIFEEKFGGEGEIVTVSGAPNNMLGTRILYVDEFDFSLEFYGNPFVKMAPPEEETNG